MDCNPTSTKTQRLRKISGMTLLELFIAMAIGMVVLAVVGSLALWSGKSFAAMANYSDLDKASRNALDRMTREIRQAHGLISYTETPSQKELALTDSDGQPVYYRYQIANQMLVRVKAGSTEPLLKDCTSLNFNLFQRNNVSNTFNQFPVFTGTNAALTCKVIQIDWICSRRLLPTELINSESVQTAKIVMRHR